MNNDEIVREKTEIILKILNNNNDLDGTTIIKITESIFINQLAGSIIGKNPINNKKDKERHYQLVEILSDYIKIIKYRFMHDEQVIAIQNGEILDDIIFYSDQLMEANMCDLMNCGGDDGTATA